MTDRNAELLIDCRCSLGEGPLWHPGRGELFFFDINEHTLFRATARGDILAKVRFDEPVSAAAVIDNDRMLIASASALLMLDIASGSVAPHLPLEAGIAETRANDCRVSPHGAWWIGTMGKRDDAGIGSVYHYREGTLATLRSGVEIPNAICFAPDGRRAYFADTLTRRIESVALDPATGLPAGDWELFVDLAGQPGAPDGAVTDAEGCVWNAEYGGGRVVRYTPDGQVDRIVELPCPNVTCPAFGGDDLKTLFITTASQGMTPAARARCPEAGGVFALSVDVAGLPETPLRL